MAENENVDLNKELNTVPNQITNNVKTELDPTEKRKPNLFSLLSNFQKITLFAVPTIVAIALIAITFFLLNPNEFYMPFWCDRNLLGSEIMVYTILPIVLMWIFTVVFYYVLVRYRKSEDMTEQKEEK